MDLEQKKKFNYKKNKPPKTAKELEEETLIFGKLNIRSAAC
jgi:hypothetical protein